MSPAKSSASLECAAYTSDGQIPIAIQFKSRFERLLQLSLNDKDLKHCDLIKK